MKQYFQELIRYYGEHRLIKRKLPDAIENLVQDISPDDYFTLTQLGFPPIGINNDFQFQNPIEIESSNELVIGTWFDKNVYYNILERRVYADSYKYFLASSIANFARQIHLRDWLWSDCIPDKLLGDYRANSNNRHYAQLFRNKLLEIDPHIFKAGEESGHAYWEALVEDIDHGIVG